jgi:putative membrane protein (TIGR04086 family)
MNLKLYLKVFLIPLIIVFSLPFLLSILNLLNIKTYNTIILVIMMGLSIYTGFRIGRITNQKGYFNGLIIGLIFTLILFLFSLLFRNTYTLNTLIYYFIIILSYTIGAMFGIQKKG